MYLKFGSFLIFKFWTFGLTSGLIKFHKFYPEIISWQSSLFAEFTKIKLIVRKVVSAPLFLKYPPIDPACLPF